MTKQRCRPLQPEVLLKILFKQLSFNTQAHCTFKGWGEKKCKEVKKKVMKETKWQKMFEN